MTQFASKHRARSKLAKDPLETVVPAASDTPPPSVTSGDIPATATQAPAEQTAMAPARIKRNEPVNIAVTDLITWDTIGTLDALNILSSPIMIADGDMVIRYVNEGAYQMFEAIQEDIRRDLPHFTAREVIGKTIDVFHKNPSYQRHLMEKLTAPHDGKFTVGGKSIAFKATPIRGAKGELSCVFVEWQDRTFAVENQSQIDRLVREITTMSDAHANGIISHFMPLDGFNSEFRPVAEGANAMVLSHIETKKKILACVNEFAKGNFNAPLERFSGERVFINDAVEMIRESFKRVTAEIQRFCTALEDGDLAVKIDPQGFSGDYRTIIDSMEGALISLNGTILTASQQVQQVSITVEQMSQSSQSLATNSQIQSSSVDEVSASTEETNIQVKSNASAADSAAKLVSGAAVVADEGTKKISEMVESMEGIRSSSQDIAKIIKVIDEIAFQTNLLALNAAVEAARAGQHGRGFAVVAQEIRNLAGRSAKAARETSDLIEDASTRVKSGVRIADETRAAFTKIAGDIQQVQTLVRDIAVASEEQARGVTQINLAVGEIAKSALATSQQADELAASATEMQSATETMRSDFSRFKLRPIEVPKSKAVSLDSLSPEMLDQLRSMMAAQMGTAGPVYDKPLVNGHANGSARGNTDRDDRGFANF